VVSVLQGDPAYIIGSPLFANVTITTTSGTPLVISAVNQSPLNVYVQGVALNGVAIDGVSVSYFDLMKGGALQFTMGADPVAF
jgi:putative alpha-1,2-mannosidase